MQVVEIDGVPVVLAVERTEVTREVAVGVSVKNGATDEEEEVTVAATRGAVAR